MMSESFQNMFNNDCLTIEICSDYYCINNSSVDITRPYETLQQRCRNQVQAIIGWGVGGVTVEGGRCERHLDSY